MVPGMRHELRMIEEAIGSAYRAVEETVGNDGAGSKIYRSLDAAGTLIAKLLDQTTVVAWVRLRQPDRTIMVRDITRLNLREGIPSDYEIITMTGAHVSVPRENVAAIGYGRAVITEDDDASDAAIERVEAYA